jgi:lipase
VARRAARREPTLLFVHATGFHSRVWDQLISHLPARHIIAVDQRGHGRSETVPRSPAGRCSGATWRHSSRRSTCADWSASATAWAHTRWSRPPRFESARFERLALIDPVIASPAAYHLAPPFAPGQMHPAAKRQNRFDSPQAMIERFAQRPPYTIFDPAALRDYCEHGLLPAPDGDGYVLACSPQTEASVYMTGRTNAGVYASVRALEIPVLIVRAKLPPPDRNVFDYSSSPTWPGLVGEFRRAREVHLPERTHFLPMESPAEVAALLREAMALPAGTP